MTSSSEMHALGALEWSLWIVGGGCLLAFFALAPLGGLSSPLALAGLPVVAITALVVARRTHYRRRLGSWSGAPEAPMPFARRPPTPVDEQIVAEAPPLWAQDEPDPRDERHT